MPLRTKRVYEEHSEDDGYRVLVDRVWPRGVSKEKAHVDEWLKNIGPSTQLRKWFGHEDARWTEFQSKYRAELDGNSEVDSIKRIIKEHPVVTLIYSAHNENENQAVVLRDYLS